MSTTVPLHRPGVVRLSDLPPEEQAKQAQRDATNALIKCKRLQEDVEALKDAHTRLVKFVFEVLDRQRHA